jgi:PAS domain S-box-containing protein
MDERSPGPAARNNPAGDLARAQAELEQLYRTSPVGLCVYDRDLRYVRINERLAAINGRPIEEHIGRTIHEVVPEIAGQVEPLYRRVLETGVAAIDVEVRCAVPSDPDTVRHWLVSSHPFNGPDGRPIGVSCVVRDVTEIHRARHILEVSEGRYRSLVEQAPDAIVVLDVETGRFVDCNQNALDLFGVDRETMLTIGPIELSPPRQPDGRLSSEVSRENRAAAVNGAQLTFKWTHRHADGHPIPCEVRLTRLPAEKGNLLRGSIIDISDRMRAEQELQSSEARYRSLVENSADAICILDSETGRFVDCNQKALDLFGLPRERFLAAAPADVSPDFQPDGRRSDERVRALVAEARQGGGVVTFEWTHRKADGRLAPCEIRLLRLPGHDGRLVHGSVTDISERKRAEQARLQYENRLRLLVESTDAVPWEADLRSWLFTYVGPQAERLLGYPVERWYEQGFWESCIHPEDREAAVAFCKESAAACENYAFEYRMIAADGRIVWIHDLVSVEQDAGGVPCRLHGFMLDVTTRKRGELLQAGQKRVLERLVRGEDLAEVLGEMALAIDAQQAGMKACILLLDEEGERLRSGAAPHLPPEYIRLIDGLRIGPQAGSCGTATYCGRRVVVSDIGADPLWDDYREAAFRFGLQSCWSEPIFARSGAVLGSLAIYHDRPCAPSAADLALMEQAAYLAGVAIEKYRSLAALQDREAALRRSQADLQHLAGRLISAQEEERRRLARDLHDDLTQRLAALAIEAGTLEVDTGAPAERLRDGLRRIRREMVRLSEEVHGVSRQLHPAVLEDLGLVDALDAECARFTEREGIVAELRASGVPAEMPLDVALCCYRVAQECLRNISRHSRAKTAQISLQQDNGAIRMTIVDDGDGFDPLREEGRGGGVGLASIGERIRLVNGSLGIRSRAGRGTTIEVRIPLAGTTASPGEAAGSRAEPGAAPAREQPDPRPAAPAPGAARSRRGAPGTVRPRRPRAPHAT